MTPRQYLSNRKESLTSLLILQGLCIIRDVTLDSVTSDKYDIDLEYYYIVPSV